MRNVCLITFLCLSIVVNQISTQDICGTYTCGYSFYRPAPYSSVGPMGRCLPASTSYMCLCYPPYIPSLNYQKCTYPDTNQEASSEHIWKLYELYRPAQTPQPRQS